MERRTVGHVAETLRALRSHREQGCSLLIGAGCSVTGGIPAASEIVRHIEQNYQSACRNASAPTYSHLMAELSPGQRREVLGAFLDRARVNWAHIAIAQLMRDGYVDRVLTTNFDPLIVKACAMLDIYPAVYDFAADHTFNPGALPELAVFYLHGQGTSFVQMHTDAQVRSHAARLTPVFREAGVGRTWVVVGYSGNNDPVFEQLADVPVFDHWLYWVGYQNRPPMSHVRDRLLQPGKYAALVGGFDADGFFVELAQRLSCFPPEFVRRPFSFMKRQLERVTPYAVPAQESSIDVMQKTLSLIEKAIATHEESDAAGELETQLRLLRGDYEGVVAIPSVDDAAPSTAEARAWARLMLGNRRATEAAGKPPDEARRLCEDAGSEYLAGLGLSRTCDPHLLTNWGALLVRTARASADPECELLLDEAEEKYREALVRAPGFVNALNNHANLLALRADRRLRRGDTTGATALFDAAEAIYDELIRTCPTLYQPRLNRGALLLHRASALPRNVGAEERSLLRERAQSDLRAALELEPDAPEALEKLGHALLERGKLDSVAGRDADWLEAERLLEMAGVLDRGRGLYDLACLSALRGDEAACVRRLAACRDAKTLPSLEHIDQDPDLTVVRRSPLFQEFRRALPGAPSG